MLTYPARFVALAALATLGAASAQAAGPHLQIAPPRCDDRLPVFGMHTYNQGHGEHVVRVNYGGVAWRLGIEPGDRIVRLNHYALDYHGSWEHALRRAMRHGGHVDLTVVDVRTGRLVRRHVDLDGHWTDGPIVTPKSAPVARHNSGLPTQPRFDRQAPITLKSQGASQHGQDQHAQIRSKVFGGLREALRRP